MIIARDIRKLFGATPVLDHASLDVGEGECVALLGANGAGKSTFLRIAATALRPTRGTLSVFGENALRFPERVRGRLGLVAHGSHVYEDLTAVENLKVWRALSNHPTDRAALRDALVAVGLEDVADERARSFSAGMKRRLSLARFVGAPVRLLLLDEPYSSLDPRSRKWLTEFLNNFKSRGGSILMATHNFDESLDVADRFAVLADGAVALDRPRDGLDRRELETLFALHTEPS